MMPKVTAFINSMGEPLAMAYSTACRVLESPSVIEGKLVCGAYVEEFGGH